MGKPKISYFELSREKPLSKYILSSWNTLKEVLTDFLGNPGQSNSPGVLLDASLLAEFFSCQKIHKHNGYGLDSKSWSTTFYGGAELIRSSMDFAAGPYSCTHNGCSYALPGMGFVWSYHRDEHEERYHNPKQKDKHQNFGDYLIVDPESTRALEPITNGLQLPTRPSGGSSLQVATKPADGIFARLPPEITATILCLLPLQSVYSLRLASRTIALEGFSSTFLLSRYMWPHELYNCPLQLPSLSKGNCVDWTRSYQALANAKGPGLQAWQNRRRIWQITLEVVRALKKGKPFLVDQETFWAKMGIVKMGPPPPRNGAIVSSPAFMKSASGRILDLPDQGRHC